MKDKKYLLGQLVKNDNVVVFLENEEQYKTLKDTGVFNMCKWNGAYCYNLLKGNFGPIPNKNSVGWYGYENKEIIQFNQIITDLPVYFSIKFTGTPLWNKYIEWLIEISGEHLNGIITQCFYGFNGFSRNGICCYYSTDTNIPNNPTIITLQQWDEAVNGFNVPDRWYCRPNTEEEAKILGRWFDENKEGCSMGGDFYQKQWKLVLGGGLTNKKFGYGKHPEATEITFEQFKKHIYNKNQKEMEKEITGYKFKPGYDKYIDAYSSIADSNGIINKVQFIVGSLAHKRLIEAGVLDLWFEPVYKDEGIVIRGYNVEFKDNHIQVCAQRISNTTVKEVYKLQENYGFSFDEYKEEIKRIALRIK